MRHVARSTGLSLALVLSIGCGSSASTQDSGADAGASDAPASGVTCDPSQPFGAPTPFAVNVSTDQFALRFSADGLTAYGVLGPDDRIAVATRASLSAALGPWTAIPDLSPMTAADGSPSVTGDGLQLFFTSQRNGINAYVYSASRASTSAQFANGNSVTIASEPTSLTVQSLQVSPDGLTLFLAAKTSGDNYDLFRTSRRSTDTFFDALVAIDELDSPTDETAVAASPDALVLYWSSARSGGAGDQDIWMATRATPSDRFGAPKALKELNGASADVVDFVTADACTIYFHSRRTGTFTEWIATRPH